jgi:hypothetical protein
MRSRNPQQAAGWVCAIVVMVALGALGACSPTAFAQSQSAATPADLSAPLAALKDLSSEITGTLDSTHWQKWKLKPEQKDADDRALTSLHRNLDQVLPPLLDAAQKSPASVPAGLAVYRNVNAFYNVMLRLEQTAEFIAKDDAQPLNDELARLEIVRNTLGEKLLAMARQQESDLTAAHAELAELREAAAAAAEHPKHVVVDDGAPDKKKPAAKKSPATKPAATKSSSTAKPAPAKPSAGTQPQ